MSVRWVSCCPFKTNSIKALPKIPLAPRSLLSKQSSASAGNSILLSALRSAYNEGSLDRAGRAAPRYLKGQVATRDQKDDNTGPTKKGKKKETRGRTETGKMTWPPKRNSSSRMRRQKPVKGKWGCRWMNRDKDKGRRERCKQVEEINDKRGGSIVVYKMNTYSEFNKIEMIEVNLLFTFRYMEGGEDFALQIPFIYW